MLGSSTLRPYTNKADISICAACRYGFMMRLGSVILKVTDCFCVCMMYEIPRGRLFNPHTLHDVVCCCVQVTPRQVADTMWYFPLLQPYVDHVYPIWTRRYVGVARMMRSVVRLERMPKSFTKNKFQGALLDNSL